MPATSRPARRIRADALAVSQGVATDLRRAAALILAGEVFLRAGEGRRVAKPGDRLPERTALVHRPRRGPYASRAGLKLEGALRDFDLDVRGRRALDVGAATGGFTDCLLGRGARHVTAVDVGRNLIRERLRADPRVTLLEGVNARRLTAADVPAPFDLITVDVSFISARRLLPALVPLLSAQGDMLVLVKPQFEAPRRHVEHGGIVTDPDVAARAVDEVAAAAGRLGLAERGRTPAAIRGAEGNQEHILWLSPLG